MEGLIVYKDKIINRCLDKSIKIWDLKGSGNDGVTTIQGYEINVSHILIYENKLIGCFDKGVIKIWNLEQKDNEPFKILKGHTMSIRKIATYNNRLITCSADKTIKLWNLQGEEDNYLESYDINTHSLLLCGGYLYTDDNDKIKIWKYIPYFEDYRRALEVIFKIINSKSISFRNKLYKGKFYQREVKLLMDMCDIYNNN